jgi:CheY-like chemotaxis protein
VSHPGEPPAEILLVEDSPSDIGLLQETLSQTSIANALHVVRDGCEALAFLRRQPPFEAAPRPDLILLDLNLPKIGGAGVLEFIKADATLAPIPVIVLTTSTRDIDVLRSYQLHANCYLSKPMDFRQFATLVRTTLEFWLSVARLPAPTEEGEPLHFSTSALARPMATAG